MQRFAAELRHRELTQELFDIGDEVASYIENLAEAVADYDAELVEDCLDEFDVIAGEGRADARVVLGELIGLRQALVSGVRSGTISAQTAPARPAQSDPLTAAGLEAELPLGRAAVTVAELSGTLDRRTRVVGKHLSRLVAELLAVTETVARDLEALSYPHYLAGLAERVRAAGEAWLVTVARAHPAYTRARRGCAPPAFLAERARVDAVVARVAARRARATGSAG